ncbi:MAG: AbrB/MazE/SpoVT family DNA-binding domain-containing protein [Candidatus Hydrothermarchaeota archaeon]|nr:AbrB/MazE/SpoVT family DNA-binding domain-containing protein [Candidatus Hydrothermarchaeota archaeon]
MVVRMVYKSKVTEKFQVTIPKELREAYNLKAGATISFMPKKDGIEVKFPKKIENIAEKLYGVAKFEGDAVKIVHKLRSELR